MKSVRILVGDMPLMMRAIVEKAVREQSDMQLIERGAGDVLSLAKNADVAILAERKTSAPSQEQLLLEHPRLKVLVVSRDGREAHLLEFRQTPLVQVSPQGLIDAIRAAVSEGYV